MSKSRSVSAIMGRPSRHETEGALEIVARLQAGEPLHRICADEHLPDTSTVYGWLDDGKHPRFAEAFRKARRVQAHKWAGQVVEIADAIPEDPSAPQVFRAQTMIRARQWGAARALPEEYAEPRIAPAGAGATASVHVYLPAKVDHLGDNARVIEHEPQPEPEPEPQPARMPRPPRVRS